jgi:hypothetical protein
MYVHTQLYDEALFEELGDSGLFCTVLTPGKKLRSSEQRKKFEACDLVAIFVFRKCFKLSNGANTIYFHLYY